MKAYCEKVPSGHGSLVVFERADPVFPFDWHYHPELELTLIVNSGGQRLVGDTLAPYESGDLVLLGPNLPHTWRSNASTKMQRAVVVQFRGDALGDRFFSLDEMQPVAGLFERAACGLGFGQTACARRVSRLLRTLPSIDPSRRLVAFLDILLDLATESSPQKLSAAGARLTGKRGDRERIETICQYLDRQFASEIDFAHLATLIHMNQAAVCRFFKRAAGRTMTAYITDVRVAAATRLLLETDLSVLEIGFRVGFGNYSNFNRQFKRVKGVSPRGLREQATSLLR